MPQWSDIELNVNNGDPAQWMQQFKIELNRRLRYMLANIDITQLLINLNDISGTLNLSKGGTGSSLTAPSTDKLLGYDQSAGNVDFFSYGKGLLTSGTTIVVDLFAATSGTIGELGSTGQITANKLASSSASFGIMTSSSATIGQLGSTGSATFNTITSSSASISQLNSTGGITINNGTYDGGHLILGNYHIWIDTVGNVRVKDGAPTSSTDGISIGMQTS